MSYPITSERLILRELTASDCLPQYVAWLADPEVNKFLETRHSPQSESDVVGFVERIAASPDEFLFGIFLRTGCRHIGNIKLGPIVRKHRLADVSLFLGARDCWSKGYASEAITALSLHAFREHCVAKISASMYAANEGSKRAFLKAGYQLEGVRREHYDLGGARCDLIELGLTPHDLENA